MRTIRRVPLTLFVAVGLVVGVLVTYDPELAVRGVE